MEQIHRQSPSQERTLSRSEIRDPGVDESRRSAVKGVFIRILRKQLPGLDPRRTLTEDFQRYLSILLRYRWLILGITAAASMAVIAFCAFSVILPPGKSPLPNVYTASAIILVQQSPESDLSSAIRSAMGITAALGEPQQTGFEYGAFLLMVLQSRSFLDKIAEEFGIVQKYGITHQIRSQSRKMLLSNLRFNNDQTTGAITISYTDIDPVFAKNLANGMVSLLSEWYSQNMGSSNLRQRQLLEDKVAEVKAEVDRLEGRQNELQKKYGVLTAQDLGASQASALAALRAQLILKDIDIKNYSNISSARDPKLLQLQGERQNIIDIINRMQGGVPETQGSIASPESFPDAQTEFNNLSVELDVQSKIYNTLSHQLEGLKLTSDTEPPFRIMQLAEVPDAKSGPQRMRIVGEVVAVALIASVLLAFFLNGISEIGSRKPVESALVGPTLQQDLQGIVVESEDEKLLTLLPGEAGEVSHKPLEQSARSNSPRGHDSHLR